MAVTDLTGTTWVLNDTITFSSSLGLSNITSFNFTSNNASFYGFYFDFNSDGDNSLGYRTNQEYAFNEIYDYRGNIVSGKEAYKTIAITGGTDATNSALISWFETNAVQQSTTPRKSIDLTTLPGWSSLSSGSHSITIVAKADGYRDSEPSAPVSVEKEAEEELYITFTGESSDFTLTATNKEWDGTVEYSTDTTTWTEWDGTEISSSSQKLYLRGSGNTTFWTSNGAQFVLSARAGCSGNLNTLLEYSNPPTTLSANNCYYSMFWGCEGLISAPKLPATTLANNCYYSMFWGCTSLTTAPELPATTLADDCYDDMFNGCTSLTTAPTLPATTLAPYCYSNMFAGCTNLTTAPDLPATTLAEYCYASMFNDCVNLVTAPKLPATTLASACYRDMFDGCTSLTTAPALPATTLVGYCYEQMFQRCTGLTTAPALPATTLATGCYYSMFNGCTSLTTAPALPATTLAGSCYRYMFYGCTSFKVSSTQTETYQYAWRIPTSGTISSTLSNWNTNMLSNTGGTFTSNPSINTTYYVENEPV